MPPKKKARRTRSPHPGVVLIKPDAQHPYWRARFDDPETGRSTKVRLDPLIITTAEARRDWAIRRAKDLARVRMDHAANPSAPRLTTKELEKALDDYFEAAEDRLRPTTLELYRAASKLLLEWAAREGIEQTKALTAPKLPGFRDYLLAQRKQGYVAGSGRGSRRATREKLSPRTVNWQLRAVKTMLNDLRIRGIVPLSRDAIADNLKPANEPKEAPEFLPPKQCAQLLEAALRHDAATFAATRDEHAKGEGGVTRRYDPIAPFVATTLLTGMRLGEALALRWRSVDLGAVDADGKVVGEIRLKAGETKTHHARTISLDVSPTVRTLLAALKLRAGNAEYVFGGKTPLSRALVEAARRRLVGTVPEAKKKVGTKKKRKVKVPTSYGAPSDFTWQVLRSSCATYQCNAPSLFGAAAAFVSAKRLGHSITVSEKHYAGLFAVSREARTLEAAMGIEEVMVKVVASSGAVGSNERQVG